jgi:hypothetical protein
MSSTHPSRYVQAWVLALIIAAVAAFLPPSMALGAGQTTISAAETFESYAKDYDIEGSQGWSHGPFDTALVSNIVHHGLETPFLQDGQGVAYTNILLIDGSVSNVFAAIQTNLVYVDMMIRPTSRPEVPDVAELGGDPQQNLQVAAYVNATNQLVIYHGYFDGVYGLYKTKWTTIPSPLVHSNEWTRLTFTFCYRQAEILKDAYFMVQIDGSEPFSSEPYGYARPTDNFFGADPGIGLDPGGPWFQTCNSKWYGENLAPEDFGWINSVEFSCQNMPMLLDNLSVTSPPPSSIGVVVDDKSANEGD